MYGLACEKDNRIATAFDGTRGTRQARHRRPIAHSSRPFGAETARTPCRLLTALNRGKDAYHRRKERGRRRGDIPQRVAFTAAPNTLKRVDGLCAGLTTCVLQSGTCMISTSYCLYKTEHRITTGRAFSSRLPSSFNTSASTPPCQAAIMTIPTTTTEPQALVSLHLYRIQPIYTPKEISCLIKNLLARDADRCKILRNSSTSTLPSRSAAERPLIAEPAPDDGNGSE